MRRALWMALLMGCDTSGPHWGPDGLPPLVDNGPSPSAAVYDVFVQALPAQVDVLWAVDRSPSVGPLRLGLATEAARFLEPLLGSGIDWHVGAVSTAPDADGALTAPMEGVCFLAADTPVPDLLLADLLGVGGAGEEPQAVLGAVHSAWFEQADATNAGFYRAGAEVLTIAVTGGDDATTALSPDAFVADYATLGSARTFTVLGDPSDSAVLGGVADDLGGAVLDASAPDLGAVLEALGSQAGGYAVEFFLSRSPVVGTLDVTVLTEDGGLRTFPSAVPDPVTGAYAEGFLYDSRRNSVSFVGYRPEASATVTVGYIPAASATEQ